MKLLREKTPRKFQVITVNVKKQHLIENYLINKPYFLKDDNSGNFVTGIEICPDGRVIVETKARLTITGDIVMYNMFKKYIEFRGTVDDNDSPERYLINIHTINIAVEDRVHQRKPVDGNLVTVSNFRASRNTINASLFNIPTSVKVHLKQYQQLLVNYADEVTLDVFDKSREKLEIVRKTGKILYIKNTADEKSYSITNKPVFVNYAYSTDAEVRDLMREYKDRKIVSEMIAPVIYTGHDAIPIPLGYIQLTSKSKLLDESLADVLVKTGAEIVQKMRDSNTVMINERQQIEDISNEGLRLRIKHDELKKLLPEQSGLTFDVIFKMTQPITISTEVIYVGTDAEDVLAGFKIVGFSSKNADSTRFLNMLSLLGM